MSIVIRISYIFLISKHLYHRFIIISDSIMERISLSSIEREIDSFIDKLNKNFLIFNLESK